MKSKINYEKSLVFIGTFMVFTFFLLCYYPGIITYDGNVQWMEVISGNITNSHPFISTYFMYLLSFIYKSPTIVIIFQMLVASLTLTKICSMVRLKNRVIKYICYFFIIAQPIISIYTITLWKDVLYSYYLLNSGLLIYEWSRVNFNKDFKKKYLLAILLALAFSYRVNGMIAVVLLLLTLIIIMKVKKVNWKNIVVVPLTFIIVLGIFTIPKHYYLSKVSEGTQASRGVLDNYMIWITGTYLREGNIAKEDKEFLNNIANLESWRIAYNPYLINNSNEMSIDVDFLNDNREKFRKLFVKMTKDNPILFIVHYIKADSLLISPITLGYVYTYDFSVWDRIDTFDNKINPIIPGVHKYYDFYINITTKGPIIKYFYNPANAMYISIMITIYLVIKSKDKKYLLFVLPMLYNTVSLLPINIAQDLRYVYINYLTLLCVLVLLINNVLVKKDY